MACLRVDTGADTIYALINNLNDGTLNECTLSKAVNTTTLRGAVSTLEHGAAIHWDICRLEK